MDIASGNGLAGGGARTLIADDQPDVLEALRLLLKGEGYQTEAVNSPAAVLDAVKSSNFDLLLMDLNYTRDTTSGQEGLDLLARVQDVDSTLPIVVMTAWGTVDLSVEAMRHGVRDFILKPWDNKRLLSVLRTQIEFGQALRKKQRLKAERAALGQRIREAGSFDAMVRLVAERLEEALESRGVIIFTRAGREHAYSVAAASGAANDFRDGISFEPDPRLLELIESDAADRPQAHGESVRPRAGETLIAPILGKEEITGFICVGDKRSGGDFDAEDLKFLDAVVDQLGSGLTNLRLRDQQHELGEARAIQQRLLPKLLPHVQGCQISANWRPAQSVGGDYFDILPLSENAVALCIADVSGKGLPAALLMSNVQAAVKAFASDRVAPALLCEKVNRVISGNIAEDKFITLFYCLIDIGAKKLVYANAGHNAPILARRDGEVLRLDCGGTVLGPFPGARFEQDEVELKPGDRLLLFTDGITEALGADNEEFGEQRLVDLLVGIRSSSAADLQAAVMAAVDNFSNTDLGDDATLIALSVEEKNFEF